jgi:hypothetical protein
MTPSGVRQLLSNRVYLGELRVGEHVNTDAHEPLVDVDLWESAQLTVPRPGRRDRPPALLAGLARCAGCGHLLTRGGTTKYPAYTCPTNHSGGKCPEPAVVTVKLLDAHVERIALGQLARLSIKAMDGKGAEKARERLASAERELAAYLEAVSAAAVGAEAFAAGAKGRREAVDAATAELEAEVNRGRVTPFVGSGIDAWRDLGPADRNTLLRGLLSAVIVKRAGGRGARVPLEDRVRVLRFGADVRLPERRGGEASGIVPIPLPDADDPAVLGVPSAKDALKGSRRASKMRRDDRIAA